MWPPRTSASFTASRNGVDHQTAFPPGASRSARIGGLPHRLGRGQAAAVLLMPVGSRRELMNLPDELWTTVNIEYYADAQDGVFKVLE